MREHQEEVQTACNEEHTVHGRVLRRVISPPDRGGQWGKIKLMALITNCP